MTQQSLTRPMIPYTDKLGKGSNPTFKYNSTIQFLYPLAKNPNQWHTTEKLQHRHTVLTELNKYDDLWDVAENYHKCHHPDHFGFFACEEHPEAQAHGRPHSCGETTICEECAHKHHVFEAGRWSRVMREHLTNFKTYHKPYHITLTTGYQLGTGVDKEHVSNIMRHVTRSFRRYFTALAKVSRWHYARLEFKKTKRWTRCIRARHNALKSDKIARMLWYDLRRIKAPHWWNRTRLKLTENATLKQLGIGVLYSSEFGEKGHHLHAHAYYHGLPLNIKIFQKVWHEITGYTQIKIQPVQSANGGVQEVTKYATKLTTCPVQFLPVLCRAFRNQRRIRAIGAFHGLVSEYEENFEHLCCEVCGKQLTLFSEGDYQHLISLITGYKSGNSGTKANGANAPPQPKQLELF